MRNHSSRGSNHTEVSEDPGGANLRKQEAIVLSARFLPWPAAARGERSALLPTNRAPLVDARSQKADVPSLASSLKPLRDYQPVEPKRPFPPKLTTPTCGHNSLATEEQEPVRWCLEADIRLYRSTLRMVRPPRNHYCRFVHKECRSGKTHCGKPGERFR